MLQPGVFGHGGESRSVSRSVLGHKILVDEVVGDIPGPVRVRVRLPLALRDRLRLRVDVELGLGSMLS